MDKEPEQHAAKHFVFVFCHLSSQLEVKHPFSFALLLTKPFVLLLQHVPMTIEVYEAQGHQDLQDNNDRKDKRLNFNEKQQT